MTQYPEREDAKFTEKQLIMRIYDSLQDIIKSQSRTEEKMDGLCKTVDRQQSQIDVLVSVQNKVNQLEQKIDSIEVFEQKTDEKYEKFSAIMSRNPDIYIIAEDINKILNTYRNKLAPNLDLEQIEHDIEKLPGVKVARVNFGASDYQTNKKYRLYDMVTIPDVYTPEGLQTLTFYCSRVLAKTGETEPDWSHQQKIRVTLYMIETLFGKMVQNMRIAFMPNGKKMGIMNYIQTL